MNVAGRESCPLMSTPTPPAPAPLISYCDIFTGNLMRAVDKVRGGDPAKTNAVMQLRPRGLALRKKKPIKTTANKSIFKGTTLIYNQGHDSSPATQSSRDPFPISSVLSRRSGAMFVFLGTVTPIKTNCPLDWASILQTLSKK